MRKGGRSLDRRIIILGDGSHARVLVNYINEYYYYWDDRQEVILGLTGPEGEVGPGEDRGKKHGVPVIGDDGEVYDYPADEVILVNGLGSTGDTTRRREVYEKFVAKGYRFLEILHPSANILAPLFGEGIQVMAGAIIHTGCTVGNNVLVNTGAVLDHDCKVGDHAHVATRAVLAGGVTVGEWAHVGCGATVIQGVTIGKHSTVGAGAVVLKDVPPGHTVAGSPAVTVKRMSGESYWEQMVSLNLLDLDYDPGLLRSE